MTNQATATNTYRVGDRIRFAEEKKPYTVQAISASGRYLACTYPFAARRTVIYTVVDLVAGVRGVDDSLGNSLGYETPEDCVEALAMIESGQFGFSRRRRPIPLNTVTEDLRRKVADAGRPAPGRAQESHA